MRTNPMGKVDPMTRRGLDQQLATALTGLLLLYVLVTLGTFSRIPSIDFHTVFFEHHLHLDTTKAPPASVPATPDPLEVLRHTFPVHVGDDMEVIDHPGLAFANKAADQKDLPTQIKVARFWDSTAAYGPGGVRTFLGNYGERLITPDEASKVGSFHNGLETIYISIASYRDPECALTVESIYDRAAHPERIRVAIIDQRAEGDPICRDPPEQTCEQNSTQTLCKYAHLIDYYELDARLAVGPVFGRHLGHRMFRGEYFAMQVDSHVRFVHHWEADLVEQWKSAKNEMGVLTTYLSDIIKSIDPVTHAGIHAGRPIMCQSDYEGKGDLKHLRHGQQPEGTAGIRGEPTLHPFWAAGFSFARAHFVVQLPYDQYLPMVFQGEEISMGLRGFTYGYDYYAPERSVCFHMYAIKENKEKRKKIHLFWENSGHYGGADVKAMKRLNGIIGMSKDPYFDVDEKKYGLGHARKPEKFYKTFGIHTDTQTVEANLCGFVGKPMMAVLKPHLRKDGMGINYDEVNYVYVDPKKPKPAPKESAKVEK